MTVVKINALTVDPADGPEVARRFAENLRHVTDAEGFLRFELLEPSDDRHVWLVVTHWRDHESFVAWTRSDAFAAGHRDLPSSPVESAEMWQYRVVAEASP